MAGLSHQEPEEQRILQMQPTHLSPLVEQVTIEAQPVGLARPAVL